MRYNVHWTDNSNGGYDYEIYQYRKPSNVISKGTLPNKEFAGYNGLTIKEYILCMGLDQSHVSRWKHIEETADFDDLVDTLKERDEFYERWLDIIDKEIELYLESTDDDWEEIVECDQVPDSVLWYDGEIDTEQLVELLVG